MTAAVGREQVAAVLEDLARAGGPHHQDSPAATLTRHGTGLSRMRFRRDLMESLVAEQPAPSESGRAVIVTAGPPGAGKSTAVQTLLANSGGSFLRIDPDAVKELLIRRAIQDGDFSDLLSRTLPDGKNVMPLELGGLVHAESVQIADDMLEQAMRRGQDVVIEGTMRWDGMVDQLSSTFERHAYNDLQVLSVEVPCDVACEQALDRWWVERQDVSSELGGRFVPRAAIVGCYEPGLAKSVCASHGLRLVQAVRLHAGVTARFIEGEKLVRAQNSTTPIRREAQGDGDGVSL